MRGPRDTRRKDSRVKIFTDCYYAGVTFSKLKKKKKNDAPIK